MSTAVAHLLEEALRLPDDERADLAAELLASLTPGTPAETHSEREWLSEIERRARAAIASSPGIPWTDARADIERRLRRTTR
jgi:Putative addiction module component